MKKLICIMMMLILSLTTKLTAQHNFSEEFVLTEPANMAYIELDELVGIIELHESESTDRVKVEMQMLSRSHIGIPERTYDGNFGIRIREAGNTIRIQSTSDDDNRIYRIHVPGGLPVMAKMHKNQDELIVRNFDVPIEISGRGIDLTMTGVTGPLTINSTHGDIAIDFADELSTTPSSIITGAGDIELGFAEEAKVTFRMKTGQGDITPIIPIQFNYNVGTQRRKQAVGLLNGGGQEIFLETLQGDIVIRKRGMGE